MTLLRDVIDIPESTGRDDFVLRLTEGVEHTGETIRSYVVTPALAKAFDRALGTVAAAVDSDRSQAAVLRGSFGSGKSHFMAVLHALLGGSPAARGIPELAETIARNDPTIQGRRFLRLTYHLIGARSLEDAVLGGYVRQVAELRPAAPLPQVHRSEALFDDADRLRGQLGDERFFAGLSGGGDPGGTWGKYAAAWTPESYTAARGKPPGDTERGKLVDALVRTYFRGYPQAGEYLDIDTGLQVVAGHAKSLGYDAAVLFLDELILWLASRLPDRGFVSNEGNKIAKLVESASTHRDIPLISFIAQQRNLRDFLGNSGPGNEQAAVADAFKWTEGRFEQIVLGDENLPFIVQKRLLAPKDEGARQVIDDAFRRLDRRPDVWNTLLDGINTSESHRGADEASFRRTYPFSPALVSTLQALASLMQRERTALKVMQQLLVDQRDELRVDDLIPVGDVFDYVVTGHEAISPESERHFAAARRLYEEKLRPLLLRDHELSAERAAAAGYRHPFRNDDRVVKTLLLAALAPGVPALRDLDARRVAALNHGTIASPLPGEEATTVLTKIRRWQTVAPEIQLTGDTANPTIVVRLVDVDYQGVLDRAAHVDTMGERRRLVRERVWEHLGIKRDDTLYGLQDHTLVWRGNRKKVELLYGNVRDTRELPDDRLVHEGSDWRVVVDFPFDDAGYYSSADVARVEQLVAAGVESNTLCWVPRFLSKQRLDELGRLVVLEYLLGGGGERFETNADHLSANDRVQARAILENLRTSTRVGLDQALLQAYGAAAPQPADIDTSTEHTKVLVPLRPAFSVQEPVGASLSDAFRGIVDQLLRATYPDHPDFRPGDAPVQASALAKVLGYVERAREEPGGRVAVDKADRPLLARVCEPLELGALHENVYVLDPASGFPWRNRVAQEMGRAGARGPVAVRQVRGWLDPEGRRGLARDVAGLVIAAWAAVTDRSWWQYGRPIEAPKISAIAEEMELREQPLPDVDDWRAAVSRAGAVFGVHVSDHLSVRNLGALDQKVRATAQMYRPKAEQLCALLDRHAGLLGLDTEDSPSRLTAAEEAARITAELASATDSLALVRELARFDARASDTVLSKSLTSIERVVAALMGTEWELLRSIRSLDDERRAEAERIVRDLGEAARDDEFAAPLAPALDAAKRAALRLVTERPVPPPPPPPPPPDEEHGEAVADAGGIEPVLDELREFAGKHSDRRIRVSWRVAP